MLFNRHKSAIDDLQHTLTEQASLLDAIDRSMAVIEFDLEGVVLRANDNFLKTMGYTRRTSHRPSPIDTFAPPEFGRSAQYTRVVVTV